MRKIILIVTVFIIYACKESKTTSTTSKETSATSAKADACASANFASVNALIKERCTQCHKGEKAAAGIDLTKKESVKFLASSGKFFCVAKGEECKKMPPFGAALTATQIKLVDCWVKNGMKD